MRHKTCKLTLLREQPIAAGVVISWTLYSTTWTGDCSGELVTHRLYELLPDISTATSALLCLWLFDLLYFIPDMTLDVSGYNLLIINELLRLCVSVISVTIFVMISFSGRSTDWCDRSNWIGEEEGWERTDQAELWVHGEFRLLWTLLEMLTLWPLELDFCPHIGHRGQLRPLRDDWVHPVELWVE